MRILYDGFIFAQRAGGISRYFGHLIEELPSDCKVNITVKYRHSLSFPRRPGIRQWYYPIEKVRPWRFGKWSGPIFFDLASRCSRPDVIHPTYYHLLCGSLPSLRRPIVLTVYDLIQELFPGSGVSPKSGDAAAKAACLKVADFVICISENTKKDLLRIYDFPENKVAVIPLASSLQPPATPAPTVEGRPYFLYVGKRGAYKNFSVLAAAFLELWSQKPDLKLVIVGPALDEAEKQLLSGPLARGGVVCHKEIADDELARLYSGCVAFVYPSLYEGFGIPLLEAMSCGAPVLSANTASLPEVAGNAAFYFDPTNSRELCAAMEYLLESNAVRAELVQKGRTRAALFSWQKTAQETYRVYQQVA